MFSTGAESNRVCQLTCPKPTFSPFALAPESLAFNGSFGQLRQVYLKSKTTLGHCRPCFFFADGCEVVKKNTCCFLRKQSHSLKSNRFNRLLKTLGKSKHHHSSPKQGFQFHSCQGPVTACLYQVASVFVAPKALFLGNDFMPCLGVCIELLGRFPEWGTPQSQGGH